MFRILLPAALTLLAQPVAAQTLTLPAPGDPQPDQTCENIPYSQQNCVRVLACIGDAGLYFDGNARGWNAGQVEGRSSDSSACTGTWSADGPLGMGIAQLSCDNGLSVDVLYTQQDNETGTVIGTGRDSLGRLVQVWSGKNVLEFLTPRGSVSASLPCAAEPIPIS